MDEREIIIEKVRRYYNLVRHQFPIVIEKCYLYGSFAKGVQHRDSDIDVALIVDVLPDNYDIISTEPVLWKLSIDVDYRIEPIVISRDSSDSYFLDEIIRTGIEIKT
jgi:predicted nucleotidyltransferase